MLSPLARHVVWPMHERLCGRKTFALLRRMERLQWLSPDEVRDIQQRKLRRLLLHAAQNVPFHRRRLAPVARTANHDPLAALLHIAPLTKSDIRGNLPQLTWPAAPGGLRDFTTGGSTGEPLRFRLDRRRQACDQAARWLTRGWFGVRVGDPELWLWGSPLECSRTDGLRRLRDRLVNHCLLSAFDLSAASMDAYARQWRRFRPASLCGYPSTLSRWAAHLLDRGHPVAGAGLRAVFVTGEVCDALQRETLHRCFQAPVADGYGSREAGLIAHECTAGSMHVLAGDVAVEILEGDQPVEAGAWGEIVVTHLEAYGMPILRYRTGDLGRLLPGRCACGRGLPLMDHVQGRRTDVIHLPDGTFMHGLSVIYVLRDTPGVNRFRVEQRRDYSLDVSVVLEGVDAAATCEAVRRNLRRLLRGEADVRVRRVAGLEPSASGKHRCVVSEVDAERRLASKDRQPLGNPSAASRGALKVTV